MALPFADGSFDAMVCQFDVMFFPGKEKSYREAYLLLAPGGGYVMYSASGTAATTGMAGSPTKSRPNFSRPIRRNFIECRRATTKSTRLRTR
jgi:ubiquinone/menaquinone biosynthesis C-methylase UbiE